MLVCVCMYFQDTARARTVLVHRLRLYAATFVLSWGLELVYRVRCMISTQRISASVEASHIAMLHLHSAILLLARFADRSVRYLWRRPSMAPQLHEPLLISVFSQNDLLLEEQEDEDDDCKSEGDRDGELWSVRHAQAATLPVPVASSINAAVASDVGPWSQGGHAPKHVRPALYARQHAHSRSSNHVEFIEIHCANAARGNQSAPVVSTSAATAYSSSVRVSPMLVPSSSPQNSFGSLDASTASFALPLAKGLEAMNTVSTYSSSPLTSCVIAPPPSDEHASFVSHGSRAAGGSTARGPSKVRRSITLAPERKLQEEIGMCLLSGLLQAMQTDDSVFHAGDGISSGVALRRAGVSSRALPLTPLPEHHAASSPASGSLGRIGGDETPPSQPRPVPARPKSLNMAKSLRSLFSPTPVQDDSDTLSAPDVGMPLSPHLSATLSRSSSAMSMPQSPATRGIARSNASFSEPAGVPSSNPLTSPTMEFNKAARVETMYLQVSSACAGRGDEPTSQSFEFATLFPVGFSAIRQESPLGRGEDDRLRLYKLAVAELAPVGLLNGALEMTVSAAGSDSFFVRSRRWALCTCSVPCIVVVECRSVGVPLCSFMVKTITTSEMRSLIKLLPAYVKHFHEHHDSLIGRILGCYSVAVASADRVYAILQENVFASPPFPRSMPMPIPSATSELATYQVFDLKVAWLALETVSCVASSSCPVFSPVCYPWKQGSTVDRTAHAGASVLKDSDFRRLHPHGVAVASSPQELHALLDVLHADVTMLRTEGIMDYSLLIGVMTNAASTLPASDAAATVPVVVGVIDYLQRYDMRKRMERGIKSVMHVSLDLDISAVDPDTYAKRFLAFAHDVLKCASPAVSVNPA